MEEIAYIEGNFYSLEEAKINLINREIFKGVFESLIVVKGKIFKLEEHLDRLFNSSKYLNIKTSLSKFQVEKEILKILRKSTLKEAYLRVSIIEKDTLVIILKKLPNYPSYYFTKGVGISIVSSQKNLTESLNPRVKSSNFLNNILAKEELRRRDSFEAISINSKGLIGEGTISNIFILMEDTLFTPKKSVFILDGITKNTVIDICKDLKIKVKEDFFTRYELYNAEEVFLTFTSAGILPVTMVDGKEIAKGKVGEITKRLIKEYRRRLYEE
jgi:branched-chain amino acid aminotransferase